MLTVSKIFERIIQKQIIDYVNQYLLPCYVDTEKVSVHKRLFLYFIDKLKFILDKKEYVGAILMDLSKAFNTINYELLVTKLNTYGFSKEAIFR